MVVLWLLGCERHGEPPKSGVTGDLDFGVVATGTTATRALRVDGDVSEVSTDEPGLSLRWVEGDGVQLLLVACDPDALEAESGTLAVAGEDIAWRCAAGEAAVAPLVEIGAAPAESIPETGLGDAEIASTDTVRMVPVSRSGDLFVTDPRAGRLWRQNSFYRFGTWGVWGSNDEDTEVEWEKPPLCFGDGKSSHQDGTCTGEEREADGSIAPGWSYYHGGFVDGLPGVADGVDVPGPDVVVAAGADPDGWIAVIDGSLDVRLSDEESYSYWRLVRPIAAEDLPTDLRVARNGTDAVAVSMGTGALLRIGGLDTVGPKLTKDGDVGGPVLAWTTDDLGALAFVGSGWVRVDDAVTPLPEAALWGPLNNLAPSYAASDGARLWAAWADGTVAWRSFDGAEAGFAQVPGVTALAADPLGVAHVLVGSTLLTLDSAVPDTGVTLPATPLSLQVDPLPHDVYVAYAAGDEGCDGALADACSGGEHPAVVHSFYVKAGLDQAVSTGHPMNLFFAPVIETPKDEAIDGDFSKGTAVCGEAPENVDPDLYAACCALERSSARVTKNLDYFLSDWGDATFVLGVNPSWMRQARNCLAQSDGPTRERGRTALQTLSAYVGMMEFSRWTHTGLTDPEFDTASAYYIDRLAGAGAWTPPVDDQDEYDLLHQGLAAMYDYDDLGTMDGEPLSDLELTPIVAAAGNGFDGPVMVEESWADPSWITAVRDGADDPLPAFYFASAGSIPEIGITGYRKKENFPLPIQQRAGAFEMGEDPRSWWEGGDSGMVYIGGMNWAVNTVGDLGDSGAFRETVIWGNDVEERDWVAARRYIRRTLAAAPADATKSWYVHLFDLSNNDGDFQNASGVTADSDINAAAIQALTDELITPGYARWSTLMDVVAEYQGE